MKNSQKNLTNKKPNNLHQNIHSTAQELSENRIIWTHALKIATNQFDKTLSENLLLRKITGLIIAGDIGIAILLAVSKMADYIIYLKYFK